MKTVAHWTCCWIVVVPLVWRCAPAAALIVAPPSTNDNTSAPVDDPGWLNVGDNGIYLGNRWAITAFHVGAGTTTFPGVGTFFYQSGTAVRLQNPDNADTDLLMYRLTTDPGLPWLWIASSTPAIGEEVTFIGDGGAVTPSATETHWNVTGTDPNFTWTEVGSGDPQNFSGYKATTNRKLWGTNLIEDDQEFFDNEEDADHTVLANAGFGNVISFFSEFDKEGVTDGDTTDHETQAQGGDSGSAVFAKEDGNWVLAGVTHAIDIFEDQPNVGSTAVYGNLTFAADLSRYRTQILSIANIPELGSFWLVGGVGAMVGFYRLGVRRLR